jgi:hypothetical protein
MIAVLGGLAFKGDLSAPVRQAPRRHSVDDAPAGLRGDIADGTGGNSAAVPIPFGAMRVRVLRPMLPRHRIEHLGLRAEPEPKEDSGTSSAT